MNNISEIYSLVEKFDFNISTDTRTHLKGSVFFALKGENFDGNKFINEAIKKGASAVVTQDKSQKGKKIFVVKNTLATLQELAALYRDTFNIPVIAIGGSNGKTTSKELTSEALKVEYKIHSTVGSFNNHLGVPLSILSMKRDSEIGVFEIGANHPNEHTELLNILKPNFVVVTNNGLDHLEGFGGAKGARKGNAEIYKWAKKNKSQVFLNTNHPDLVADSRGNKVITYPNSKLIIEKETPLTIKFNNKVYKTNLAGKYNIENIHLAQTIAENFGLNTTSVLNSIRKYKPTLKRSQIEVKNGTNYIIDCYNANPTSMKLALESFFNSTSGPRGMILGEMLELGRFSKKEHKKIFDYIHNKKVEIIILIGEAYRKLVKSDFKNIRWFKNSADAGEWFRTQNFRKYTFLLKGSRGIRVEKVIE
jgi:UDP-N-acetylmuramoyl-tripeptide--D-alanyl-D-alanine ligase